MIENRDIANLRDMGDSGIKTISSTSGYLEIVCSGYTANIEQCVRVLYT